MKHLDFLISCRRLWQKRCLKPRIIMVKCCCFRSLQWFWKFSRISQISNLTHKSSLTAHFSSELLPIFSVLVRPGLMNINTYSNQLFPFLIKGAKFTQNCTKKSQQRNSAWNLRTHNWTILWSYSDQSLKTIRNYRFRFLNLWQQFWG